jgi:hypothetical protein
MERSSSSPSLADFVLNFSKKVFESFEVEFTENGDDVIYHFWPRKGERDFPPDFGLDLEIGFKAVLPPTADVRADYTDRQEAAAILRFGQDPNEESEPLPTFYVRVVGWASNPMADRFLKNEVFSCIDAAVKERAHARRSDVHEAPATGGVPARDGGRHRNHRKRKLR